MKSINTKLVNKKLILRVLPVFICVIVTSAFIFAGSASADGENAKDNLATIIYTNDCHSMIKGCKTESALSYATVAQMNNDAKANSDATFVVDGGDHSWASPYTTCGPNRNGIDMIDLMRTCHYNVAVPGNHEFEYGREFFIKTLAERAKAPESGNQTPFEYYACNFYNTNEQGEKTTRIFEPYKILDIGNTGKKIAFIGIMSPESEVPTWDFKKTTIEFGEELQADVQNCIEECEKAGATYIVGVGHLGVYSLSESYGYSSRQIIAHTSGLDAFLDGHSHIPANTTYPNKDGKDVPCVQCGKQFQHIAKVYIKQDESIQIEVFANYEAKDPTVLKTETDIVNYVETEFAKPLATNNLSFEFSNPDGTKITDTRESNLGDLAADSLYWYMNTHQTRDGELLDCDFAMINSNLYGDGLQEKTLDMNDINRCMYDDCGLTLADIDGRKIIDALEWSVIKSYNPETNSFEAWKNFVHTAGIKFDVNCNIESTVQVDYTSLLAQYMGPQWLGPPTGEYRVSNVQIYNKNTGTYEDLDINKTYKVGALACLVKQCTEGFLMVDGLFYRIYEAAPYEALGAYLKAFSEDSNGLPVISTKTSPLASLPGYLINYENPYGSGRITLNYTNPVQPESETAKTNDNINIELIYILFIITISTGVIVLKRTNKLA